MRIYRLIIPILLVSQAFGSHVLSFAPILNSSEQIEITLPVALRNEIIFTLVEDYDCSVLSRSNGFPLLEEQRYSASIAEDPQAFPYPPAADFLFVGSIKDDGNAISVTLNHTAITGKRDTEVTQSILKFSDAAELKKSGADQIVDILTAALGVERRTQSRAYASEVDSQIWAVLPFELILGEAPSPGMTPEYLDDLAYSAIAALLTSAQMIEPSKSLTHSHFPGATERKAAEIGLQLGADYLVAGTINKLADGYIAHIRAVRCNDGAVIAARRLESKDWHSLEQALPSEIQRLVLSLPETTPFKAANTEAALEEAMTFQGIADTLAFSSSKDTWIKYQAARTFQVAAMLAQDTEVECSAIERMSVCVINHPLIYGYRNNWEGLTLSNDATAHNDWLLSEIEKMASVSPLCNGETTFMKALDKSGQWDRAYAILQREMERQGSDYTEYDRRAAERIRITSLSGRAEEAEAFFQRLTPGVRQQFTLIQAALHYRRTNQPEQEFAVMRERLEKGEWRTIDGGFSRLCALMKQFETPKGRLQLIELIPAKFRKDPNVQVLQFHSYMALGQRAKASDLATVLLRRNDIGNGGYESMSAFKSKLREAMSEDGAWLKAGEIQPIPKPYKMYLQPVGDYPAHILQAAAERAGQFFGCEFIVRPAIPTPTARSVYYKDMIKYVAVPLLRRFVSARPPPEDAIYQVYLVDQRFLAYGRGPTTTCYRKGLGYLLSYEPYQRYIDSDQDRIEALSYGLIHGFRFFIERSQEIWLENAPNNFPCANSRANSVKTWKRENGYCPECIRNYRSADMEAVFVFIQGFPHEESFSNEFMGWRHPIDQEERMSIRNYAEKVGSM